jgi:GNAT superfamily N-acetyltransferase
VSRPVVRRATTDDVAELTRLRGLMLAAVHDDFDAEESGDAGWRRRSDQRLAELMAGDDFAAFVVDDPGGGLAACAAGWVDRRLPGPGHDGLAGFLGNVCTDPAHRRRGLARAVVVALMAWFDERGVSRIDLHASREGQAIYEQVGFSPPAWPALRWRAPRR